MPSQFSGDPPKKLWRFEFMRPRGGLSVWYAHGGYGWRLFIVNRHEASIDWGHIRRIVRAR